MNINDYVLIDCGLIHQHLIKKENTEKLENETFFTVQIVNELIDYKIKNNVPELILISGSETLKFKRVNTDKYLEFMLDEF